MKKLTPLFGLFAVLLPAAGLAQGDKAGGKPGPIQTDRPDFTDSPQTVPLGFLQVETGYQYTRQGASRQHAYGMFLLRIPGSERSEYRVALNSYSVTKDPTGTSFGLEDTTLQVKYRFRDQSDQHGLEGAAMAVFVGATVPTGSPATRENAVQPELTFAIEKDITEKFALASNLIYTYASEGGQRFSQFSGSLSASYKLTDRLGSFLEFFANLPGSRGGPNGNYIDGGFTYLVCNNLSLDLYGGVGLNGTRPDEFFGFGASVRW